MNRTLVTIAIPCYNGKPYIDVVINSLINQKLVDANVTSLYEIILVDDGSKDNSSEIALEMARYWNGRIRKDFIRVITKPNGQYGSVINRAIKEANGIYLKIVDVDDTVNNEAFQKYLTILAGLKRQVDVVLTDSYFEKIGNNKIMVQQWTKWMPANKILDYRDLNFPRNLVTMHNLTYRLDFLKEIKYEQVEKVYYSDSQYSTIPLSKAASLYYIKQPLYRYYIGRNDQSVNKDVMIRNKAHQRVVVEAVWRQTNLDEVYSKGVMKYIMYNLRSFATWTIVLNLFDPNCENPQKEIKSFFKELKEWQPEWYSVLIRDPFLMMIRMSNYGYGVKPLIIVGGKLYGLIKNNIIDGWF